MLHSSVFEQQASELVQDVAGNNASGGTCAGNLVQGRGNVGTILWGREKRYCNQQRHDAET
jgi:hypothetical protein